MSIDDHSRFKALAAVLAACFWASASSPAAFANSGATVEVSPLAAAAAQSYADSSRKALDRMLDVMVVYGNDQKSMQKAMDMMHAVKRFEASTAAEYERAKAAIADTPTLLKPLNAYRADQQELAGRLMRAEPSDWDGILAGMARLEVALRAAAKPMIGT